MAKITFKPNEDRVLVEPAAAEVLRYLSTLCTYLSEIAAFEVVMNNMYVFTINHI